MTFQPSNLTTVSAIKLSSEGESWEIICNIFVLFSILKNGLKYLCHYIITTSLLHISSFLKIILLLNLMVVQGLRKKKEYLLVYLNTHQEFLILSEICIQHLHLEQRTFRPFCTLRAHLHSSANSLIIFSQTELGAELSRSQRESKRKRVAELTFMQRGCKY